MKSFPSKFGAYALGVTAMVFCGILWAGCGSKTNPAGPIGNNPSLVLPAGQTWIDTDKSGGTANGVIFTKDGRFLEIYKNRMERSWRIERDGAYTMADGIEVKITFSVGDTGALLFRLSGGGDTLTLYRTSSMRPPSGYDKDKVYAKTSGVNITIPPPNLGTGGNLALGSNEAWINTAAGIGFISRSDSTVAIVGGANGVWHLGKKGTYSTSDEGVTFSIMTPWYGWSDYDYKQFPYTVSGNSLVISWESGNVTAFTKTSNVTTSEPKGGNLVCSQGQAWVNENNAGYIFDSNGKFTLIADFGGGEWEQFAVGTYTAKGSNLNITTSIGGENLSAEIKYTVSGNAFISISTDETVEVSTKKSGISIAIPNGGNLVLPSGQAWIDNDGYDGYIFKENGEVLRIERYSGKWETVGSGTYTTSGVYFITVSMEEVGFSYTSIGTYSVSGNSLTLVLGGERVVLKRTSGVNVRNNAPADSAGRLKKSGASAPEAPAGLSAGKPAIQNKKVFIDFRLFPNLYYIDSGI